MEHIRSRNSTERSWCNYCCVGYRGREALVWICCCSANGEWDQIAFTKDPTGTACRKLWTVAVAVRKAEKVEGCVYTMAGNMVASFVKTRSYCSDDLDFDVRNACNKVLWSKNQRLQICKIWVLASLSEKGRCCGANKLQQSHPSFGAGRRPMWERFAFASGCKNSWMNFLESQGIRPLNLCWLIQSGHTSCRRCATRHKAVRKAAGKRPGAPTWSCIIFLLFFPFAVGPPPVATTTGPQSLFAGHGVQTKQPPSNTSTSSEWWPSKESGRCWSIKAEWNDPRM